MGSPSPPRSSTPDRPGDGHPGWRAVTGNFLGCRCRELHPPSSCDESVLVNETAQLVAPS